MIARDKVFQPEMSIDVEPDATTLYDLSRYRNNGTHRAAGRPDAIQLPSGLWVWHFDGANDYIQLTNHPSLNFTSEPFSVEVWVYGTFTGNTRHVFNRGLYNADGYILRISATGDVEFFTNQAAAQQFTRATALTFDTWYHLIVTRSGNSVRIYENGIDATTAPGVHIDPVSNARTAKIGIYDNLVNYPFKDYMSPPIVYAYTLTPGQALQHYETTKYLFGVHD